MAASKGLRIAGRAALALAVPALVAGLAALKREKGVYWGLVQEDALFERLTLIAYLTAAPLAAAVAWQLRRRRPWLAVAWALLAVGFVFVGGEEVSWGQRWLRIKTPEAWREVNRQGELNLHNLAGPTLLHGAYILVGAYGALAWLAVPRAVRRRHPLEVDLLVPRWYVAPWFAAPGLLYVYYDYLSRPLAARFGRAWAWEHGWGAKRFMIARDQEPAELMLAIGFVLFVARAFGALAEARAGAPAERVRAAARM